MSSQIETKTYGESVKKVDQILSELQRCEDIDKVMELYENAISHLQFCEKRLESAKGKFEEINQNFAM